MRPAAELGDGDNRVGRFHLIFLAGRKRRFDHLRLAGNSRAREMLVVLDEDRVKREVVAGFFGEEGEFLVPFLARNDVSRAEKSEEAVVIRLTIIINERMIMTLGTLDVATKENSTHVTSDQIWLGAAIKIESRRGANFGIDAVGAEDLS